MASAIGAVVSGVGGLISSRKQKKAAQQAAQMAQFNPFNVMGGLGSATFNGDSLQLRDSGMGSDFRNLFGGMGQGLLANSMLGQGAQLQNFAGGMMPGLFGGAMDASMQLPTDAVNNFSNFANQQQNFLGGMGQQALQNTDFSSLAADQLSRMRAQARPQEDRAVNSKFQNLFNRGQLGTTGGAQQLGELALAQEQADISRSLNADQFANMLGQQNRQFGMGALGAAGQFGRQGMAAQMGLSDVVNSRAQQRMANAASLFGLGGQARQQDFGMGMQSFGGIMGLDNNLRQMGALGGNLGSAGASAGANAGNILMNNGGGGSPLGSFLGSLGGSIGSGGFSGFGNIFSGFGGGGGGGQNTLNMPSVFNQNPYSHIFNFGGGPNG